MNYRILNGFLMMRHTKGMRLHRRSYVYRFLASMSIAMAMTPGSISPVKSDPATTMVAIGIAENVLSLFSKGPDLTLEALKQQTVALDGIHSRLTASENALIVLLEYAKNSAEKERKLLEDAWDIERSATLAGFIGQLKGFSADIVTASKENRQESVARLRLNANIVLINMEPARNTLLERSNFVVPTLALSLVAEFNARRMLPQDGAEIPRALAAYDKKFAEALNPKSLKSLISIRLGLESLQAEKEFEITQLMTGTPGPFPLAEVDWFSHTLQANRIEKRFRRVQAPYRTGMMEGSEIDYTEVDVAVPCDVHSRTWKRRIQKEMILTSADAKDFMIDIVEIGPNQTDTIIAGAQRHHTPDAEHEAIEKAKTPLAAHVKEYNARASVINSLKGLEHIAVQCRLLIANWDENQASKIVGWSDVFREGLAAARMDPLSDIIKNRDIEDAIDGIVKMRLTVLGELDRAAADYNKAVEQARSKKWVADVGTMFQILKISIQIQQLNDRFEAIAKIADISNEAHNNILVRNNVFIKTETSVMPDDTLPNDAYISSLTEQDKVEIILDAIRYAEKQPAPIWENLPRSATLVESRLALAISLLNSMGYTYADKESAAYRSQINDANLSGNLKDILLSKFLPTPTGGSSLIDAPAQAEYRRQINALLRPYALRRMRELSGAASGGPR